jgi:hypothetical protein
MEQSGGYKRNRHSRKGWDHKKNNDNRNKQKPQENQSVQAKPRINKEISESLQQSIAENNKAIREFKQAKPACIRCGKEIETIAEAMSDRQTGEPVHFDCVVAFLQEQEKISPAERIIYIGQGRFAVAFFPNPHDDKAFSIRRVIEWETANNDPAPWRKEISGLFSQVK